MEKVAAYREASVADTLPRGMGETGANRNAAGSPTGTSDPRGEAVAGIRHTAVERFFAERVPGTAGPLRFSRISGGRSNQLAVISEGIYARWKLGKTLGDGFDGLGRAAAPLAERALAIAAASADPKLRG